ncbi:MAG TPA: hypothetical protein VM533_15310 [Fimbriiglobus sp.]|jgi:hypothetical protein|nr:hypothetical protein [Fimbriiglobus sp.]
MPLSVVHHDYQYPLPDRVGPPGEGGQGVGHLADFHRGRMMENTLPEAGLAKAYTYS